MDKIKSINSNRLVTRRIFIAVFSAFICTITTLVMLTIYNPNQNALGALSSVCMDIICMILLIILVVSFTFDNYESNRATRWFAVLLVATIWAVFLDFLNWAFDGSLASDDLTFWFTVCSLCMGSILAGIFSMYLYRYMNETHGLGKIRNFSIACAILNIISFFLTFILAITGTAFKFVDGHYETGALYDIVTVLPVLSLLFMLGVMIRYAKRIGFHDVFAVAGYIFFMIAGALIEASYNIGTTYVAVAIADIFIFIMLQNELIAQEKRNVQEWMKKSNTDVLTGFLSRHAYENDMALLDNKQLDETFVYVSVDVNSLKIVNDSNGHNAGDELLKGAAECLKKCFGPYGKLYRIGGDEFIAIIHADKEQLDKLKKEIEEITGKWSGKLVKSLALSCGYAAASEESEMPIRQLAILADKRMYEAKNDYYRRTGIDRRKR